MLNLGFERQWGQEIFLFSKIIQTGSGATNPPIQWVTGRSWVHTHFT